MRLTNAMRETATAYIVGKAYPSSQLAELEGKVIKVLESNDEWKVRERLAEQYPNIVRSLDRANFRYGDTYETIEILFNKPVATTVSYMWMLSYRKDRSESFYDDRLEAVGQEIAKYMAEKEDYKEMVHKLIQSCNTTKQLYEAIPEVAGYFGEEEKKRSTALAIPQSLIDVVRARIPQEEEA